MTKHGFDRCVEELAKLQHGVLNHGQAVLLGGSDTMVSDRVTNGAWIRLTRGVYALASYSPTWRRQYKAAELSKPGSAIRGRPAGLVHRFEGFKVLRPELVVPPGASPRSRLARVVRMADVSTTTVDGLTVTTIAQTLLDVLRDCPLRLVERAMDGSLLDGRVTLDDCEERVAHRQGTLGRDLRTMEALISERRTDGWAPLESELESALAAVLERLPAGVLVVRQAELTWWEAAACRVDFHIPAWQLIVEADGRRWHARVADFDRDRWRDNVAQANGHRVLRFTHTHVTQRPAEVLELVMAAGTWRSVAA